MKSNNTTINNFPIENRWKQNASKSRRDLIIKKIAIILIATFNLAALGAALYVIISYCPIPTQTLLVSPFIVGVLSALAYLRFPTCGINAVNYTQYTNLTTLL